MRKYLCKYGASFGRFVKYKHVLGVIYDPAVVNLLKNHETELHVLSTSSTSGQDMAEQNLTFKPL